MFIDHLDELKSSLIEFFREVGYEAPLDGDEWKRYPPKSLPDDADALLLFQDPPASIPHIPDYERYAANAKTDFNVKF